MGGMLTELAVLTATGPAPDVFADFALLLVASAIVGALAIWLRQPLLIAYILVGIILGPAVLGFTGASEQIELLAQVGVTVLLFVVGLKLDLKHIRHIGGVALATGLGQLAFTIVGGFLLVTLLGKDWVEAIYIAVALTFSSTIIIVKLLSDKKEIGTLHGRIAVGFLIVQDLAVVVAMMTMSAFRGTDEQTGWVDVVFSLSWRIAIAGVVIYALMRWVIPKVVGKIAQSQELLLIFAIAWGTALAAVGDWAGFSKEAGAFLAGFSLASTVYRDAISARLNGIRDFLLLFFFIDLGSKLDFSTLGDELFASGVLSLFVLIGNPLIVMAIMGYMGYRRRTGFLAGLTVAQISEFSIVFIALGVSLGHVGQGALGLVTLVGIITIAMSTYMILYSHQLFDKLGKYFKFLERKDPYRERGNNDETSDVHPDVIIFGMGRYGSRLAKGFTALGITVLGVEFDPEKAKHLRAQDLIVRFGDGTDSGFYDSLPLNDAGWVISTLPDLASNKDLVRELLGHGYGGKIGIVARDSADFAELNKLNVETVLYPLTDAVDYAIEHLATLVKPEDPKDS